MGDRLRFGYNVKWLGEDGKTHYGTYHGLAERKGYVYVTENIGGRDIPFRTLAIEVPRARVAAL